MNIGADFIDYIDKLNEEGVILKSGPDKYKILPEWLIYGVGG